MNWQEVEWQINGNQLLLHSRRRIRFGWTLETWRWSIPRRWSQNEKALHNHRSTRTDNLLIETITSIFSHSTMSSNLFSQLFDLTLTMDMRSFSKNYLQLMLYSSKILEIDMERFMVWSITLCKHRLVSQHKYLSVDIWDKVQHHSELVFFGKISFWAAFQRWRRTVIFRWSSC